MRIVGLGPGDPDSVPESSLALLRAAARVHVPPLDPALAAVLRDLTLVPIDGDPAGLPDDALVAAADPEAHRLATALPDAATHPARELLRERAVGAEVARLVAVGTRLRRDCPWDREQRADTIIPHTVEEVFELAAAVEEGDPVHQADELGDLLFQVVFLSRLLEEDGHADMGTVARAQADKLISRHPHVYGAERADSAGHVVQSWEARKRAERDEGIFHDIPEGLPALAHAAKTQKRAAAVGFVFGDVSDALAQLREEVDELHATPVAAELGDVLFAAVAVSRWLGADPELALRGTATRFRGRVEQAARLAAAAGERFEDLTPERQLGWYVQVRLAEPDEPPG
ncbi:MAG: nucleoside triphosphate pyrophosphohydrolase [Thermoleophilia bacterium]